MGLPQGVTGMGTVYRTPRDRRSTYRPFAQRVSVCLRVWAGKKKSQHCRKFKHYDPMPNPPSQAAYNSISSYAAATLLLLRTHIYWGSTHRGGTMVGYMKLVLLTGSVASGMAFCVQPSPLLVGREVTRKIAATVLSCIFACVYHTGTSSVRRHASIHHYCCDYIIAKATRSYITVYDVVPLSSGLGSTSAILQLLP